MKEEDATEERREDIRELEIPLSNGNFPFTKLDKMHFGQWTKKIDNFSSSMLIVFSFFFPLSDRLDVHVAVKNETNLRREKRSHTSLSSFQFDPPSILHLIPYVFRS